MTTTTTTTIFLGCDSIEINLVVYLCFASFFYKSKLSIFEIFRSNEFDPEKEDLGGRTFILFAIMTDAENDIILGTDGVEYL